MKDKIKIDIVSDVVCPWCIIGYKRLEKAIIEMGIEDQVTIEWQPFELNPYMPKEGQDLREHISEKYGSNEQQQDESQQRMTQAGAELDFAFNYNQEMRMVNTFEAHVLLDYAAQFGKQTELNLALIAFFFTDQKDVSNREVLREAMLKVGLNADEGLSKLDDKTVEKDVRDKQQYWKDMGVNSVPTVVFNRKSAVTGAQPVDTFKNILKELLDSQTTV
ncbi:DsbA family protein [Flavobacterium sp. 14A]|uniref:DsbA family oxidoreductase n=1 Tax=Flavobacterium sp. 14A TaxID=2735896 RepID=UPI00156D790E|nr:DsbA family oxidoreductase [Flavobacterium sp. 14A]NRT10661.1 putative DsbA family dithiol-disulfide isomerase [Flavobacterium sp. 14A]